MPTMPELIKNWLTTAPKTHVLGCGHRGIHIDLSPANELLRTVDVSDSSEFGAFVVEWIRAHQADFAWGGYHEQRAIYKRSGLFNDTSLPERDWHLGIDLWAPTGTGVLAAEDGVIHSFQDNQGWGNYGPTIILQHSFGELTFHTLYGHLSRESLDTITLGQSVVKGQPIGALGSEQVNGDYPPHLHFQVIVDMEGRGGDYPGVAHRDDLVYYALNCPNPSGWLDLPV
jgi:murein DD-endopeptidase MepM/ murein hydrolase activator NlpD